MSVMVFRTLYLCGAPQPVLQHGCFAGASSPIQPNFSQCPTYTSPLCINGLGTGIKREDSLRLDFRTLT